MHDSDRRAHKLLGDTPTFVAVELNKVKRNIFSDAIHLLHSGVHEDTDSKRATLARRICKKRSPAKKPSPGSQLVIRIRGEVRWHGPISRAWALPAHGRHHRLCSLHIHLALRFSEDHTDQVCARCRCYPRRLCIPEAANLAERRLARSSKQLGDERLWRGRAHEGFAYENSPSTNAGKRFHIAAARDAAQSDGEDVAARRDHSSKTPGAAHINLEGVQIAVVDADNFRPGSKRRGHLVLCRHLNERLHPKVSRERD
mmetsp:Transcript_53432/g.116485  ORF Transcript_53432/g.116485 Transcript_53432/m.116485 type:complete len:257 (-) Transcript_53432:482-1252(-)